MVSVFCSFCLLGVDIEGFLLVFFLSYRNGGLTLEKIFCIKCFIVINIFALMVVRMFRSVYYVFFSNMKSFTNWRYVLIY